jgi:PTS system N-acetylglucosamine-specific IIC component
MNVGTFVIGDFHGKTGDLNRFFAGDPSAGSFMTGFFPIMMFALPAAALAIWQEAKPAQKKIVGGIMLSAALTSFLTGVTEPLEFSFMFVAFPLYVVHAVLTGTSLALVNALGIKDGFSFSAGVFDYALNFNIATKPLLLIPIGLVYAVIYYFSFRWIIRRWNLRTPGREEDELPDASDDRAGTTV